MNSVFSRRKNDLSIFSRRAKQGQIENPFDLPDLAYGPKPQQQEVEDENAKAYPDFEFAFYRRGGFEIGRRILHGQIKGWKKSLY
jgi:hypothetical protein